MNELNIDFWYGNRFDDIAKVDCFFCNGLYLGNVYDKNGKAIGDYTESDSVKIENAFPGIFGE